MEKPDVLQRQNFVDNVIKIISLKKTQNQGFSIGINGTWGCGKTFVLNMLEEQLENEYLIFNYNAWENDFYEEPLIAILSVIIEKLNDIQKGKLKIKGITKTIAKTSVKLITMVADFALKYKISQATQNIPTDFSVSDAVDTVKEIPAEIKKESKLPQDFNTQLPLKDGINLVKKELEKLQRNRPIIFIVDELDRCLPEYAVKVLERLHHVCDGTQFYLITAYDKDRLGDGIVKFYGRSFRDEDDKNRFVTEYLKKFIVCELYLDNGVSKADKVSSVFSIYTDMQSLFFNQPDFLSKFYNLVLRFFPKRTIEQVIEKAHTVHILTKENEDDIYDYALMCAEIIVATYYYEFNVDNLELKLVEKENERNKNYKEIVLRPSNIDIPEIPNYKKFELHFDLLCRQTLSDVVQDEHQNYYCERIHSEESMIIGLFGGYILDKYPSPIKSPERELWFDYQFFQKFKENLSLLK